MFSFLQSRKRRLYEAEIEQTIVWLIARHGEGALGEAIRKAAEHADRNPRRARFYREVEKRLRQRGRG